MSYRIVVDSCTELTEEMKASGVFDIVPFGMEVGEEQIIDDETFDQADFLKKVAECPTCPKSNCPSPEMFMKGYTCDAERVYAITISAELSGSYNSAMLGKSLYEEEYGEKDIYVFNSRSASAGETVIARKIMECEEKGMTFPEVIETVEDFISKQNIYFVLESLETLRKNGRLTGIKAVAATVLNIKPYMGATPKGEITQLGQARGINKAIKKMVDVLVEEVVNPEEKILAIAHCNCPERAESVRKMIEEKIQVKEIIIQNTRGLSSMYANDGGVIVSV